MAKQQLHISYILSGKCYGTLKEGDAHPTLAKLREQSASAYLEYLADHQGEPPQKQVYESLYHYLFFQNK